MTNDVNDHDAAMSDVPSFIDFSPSDTVMDYGTDYEDEGCDINTKDVKEEASQKQYKHRDNHYVSYQDLDAMKQMIQEMRQNSKLMHQSPVYSKYILSLNNGPAPALQRRPHYCKNEKKPSCIASRWRILRAGFIDDGWEVWTRYAGCAEGTAVLSRMQWLVNVTAESKQGNWANPSYDISISTVAFSLEK